MKKETAVDRYRKRFVKLWSTSSSHALQKTSPNASSATDRAAELLEDLLDYRVCNEALLVFGTKRVRIVRDPISGTLSLNCVRLTDSRGRTLELYTEIKLNRKREITSATVGCPLEGGLHDIRAEDLAMRLIRREFVDLSQFLTSISHPHALPQSERGHFHTEEPIGEQPR